MIDKILKIAEDIGNKLAQQNILLILTKMFETKNNYILYHLKPFKDTDRGVTYWYGFLSNFSNIKDQIIFHIGGNSKDIKYYCFVPERLKNYFENMFYASFPTAEIENLGHSSAKFGDYYIKFGDGEILTDSDFNKNGVYLDPFVDVMSLYYSIPTDSDLQIYFSCVFYPKKSFFKKLSNFLASYYSPPVKDKDNKTPVAHDTLKKEVKFSISYRIKSSDPTLSSLMMKNVENAFDKFVKGTKVKSKLFKSAKLTSLNQVINFFHMPTKENYIKNLSYLQYRKLPYPPNAPTLENTQKNEATMLGVVDFKNETQRFGIKKEDKFRHIYIMGKTGTGKSTLISNMVRSDMITNNGLAVIDPHGDLIDTILEHVPSWRINDVVLFDVSDTSYPIGLNFLQYENEEQKNLIVSGIVSTFKKLYGNSWGPRLEYVLRNVLLSVIEYPNATFLHINRMLTDKNFENEVLEYVKDPIILKFWRNEFDKRTDKFKDEAIAPIVNKIGQFLSSSLVRNIFGQPKSKLNFRQLMDEGKILLVNLSKGKIGEDNAIMIGSFMVTKFQIDAMSRADIAFNDRRDFYLYIDEFQNFATESFESILSEARKYKLSLIVANQYISQLDEKIRNAIFGNVGTIISFTIGYDDSTIISSQFKEMISSNDLLSVPKFRAYIKLMIDGIVSDPFSMKTFPLPNPEQGEDTKQKIIKQTRQRYGIEKDRLEALIKVWADKTFSPIEKVMEKAKSEGTMGFEKPSQKTETKLVIEKQTDESEETSEIYNKDTSNIEIQTVAEVPQQNTVTHNSGTFSLNDIQLGQRYDGYVKLKYNYGLFVTVKGVEGLLHKKMINVQEGIRWKDVYNIGDKIKVKADEIKDVDGEQRVVWTQL